MSEAASSPVRDALRGQSANEKPADAAGRPAAPPAPDKPASSPTRSHTSAHIPNDLRLEESRLAPGLYKPVPEVTVFEWRSPSRPFKKRDRQFFVTVSVIALLVSLILFFSGQFLPIAVVISVVFLLYVLQVIPPHDINHKITSFGLNVEGNLYYWQELGRFWFEDKASQLLLNVETARFPGRVTIVLPNEHKKEVSGILSEVLLQQKPELTLYEKMSKWLQEKIPLE